MLLSIKITQFFIQVKPDFLKEMEASDDFLGMIYYYTGSYRLSKIDSKEHFDPLIGNRLCTNLLFYNGYTLAALLTLT